MTEVAKQLIRAIHRHSAMEMDNLGIVLSGEELKEIRDTLIALWVMEKLTEDTMPTVADFLAHCGKEIEI